MRIGALLLGLLFGFGLLLSGMANPAKVQGFLDWFGGWDATLAFVMGGAVALTLPLFQWAAKRPQPLLAGSWYAPAMQGIDRRLILGSALFGIGWGLAGICPGRPWCCWAWGTGTRWCFWWRWWRAWAAGNIGSAG